ncbi:GNAT family N-acetyltransferase [Streptomyces sp. NPDC093109]|uniref:GNAT family N-acetyltransferase n=1 Tax=Streptomyces sp. NPDC093109 TaxID=3154977 RepID=UPI00344FB5FA
MEPVTLTTERLLLRACTPDDIDTVSAACQDPDIQRWTTVPSPYERQHAVDFIERIAPDGWRDNTAYAFGVQLRTGGPLIASAALHFPGPGTWEVGYWTAREHRGHGYTTEAVRALSHWAFTALGAIRVEWRAEAGNAGSRAVAEKAGFTMEGTLRGGLVNKGTVRDCWIGGLLPSDLGLPSALPYLPAGE